MSEAPGPWGDPSRWSTPPPGAGQEPPAEPPPVRTAVNLMYTGAVVQGAGMLLGLAQVGEVRDQIREDNPGWSEERLDTAVNGAVGGAVLFGLVMVGLWIWMAVKNGQGRNWARVTATVFGALNLGITALGLLAGAALETMDTGAGLVLSLALAALAGVILVFLWQPESTRFFDQMRPWGTARPPR